jgi:ABC-type sugar transport system ATPase subunit
MPKDVSAAAPLVEVSGLRKRYGGVQALKGVGIDFCAGEVHGLVGANGAGKSTLIRILAGIESPDAGEIRFGGRRVAIETPDQATTLGLSFIHQELNLVPQMTALQNIMLGAPKPTRFGLVEWRGVRATVQPVAERVGIRFPLDGRVGELSVAQRWLVSICQALVRRSRLICMDEPTASLSEHECENLFRIVRDLAQSGVAVLYVSHRLDEVIDLCDRVTVFRDGNVVAEFDRAALTRPRLVEAIVGGVAPEAPVAPASQQRGDVVLAVHGLRRGRAVRGVSFDLHRGEVLGLGGLVGAGRSETVRLIFGADRPEAGSMTLDGAAFAPRSPADAVRAGVALVPEERRSEGLVLEKSVAFNLSMTAFSALRLLPGLPLIDLGRRDRQGAEIVRRLSVKTPGMDIAVGRLSGGNQQKVVIGKWLGQKRHVLILDEPTRGVDIGARGEIHRIVRDLAADGLSVIVISAETEELVALCNRVLVLVEGMVEAELKGAAITREALLYASYHHAPGEAQS